MLTSLLRRGTFGCLGLTLIVNVAMAQPGSVETGGEPQYGGGSQGVQEKMYEDRMKDFQEPQSQGIEEQKGMQGQQRIGGDDPSLRGRSHESRQKMQQEPMMEQGSQGQRGTPKSGSSMEQQKGTDK